jgi:putative oxidoreductase
MAALGAEVGLDTVAHIRRDNVLRNALEFLKRHRDTGYLIMRFGLGVTMFFLRGLPQIQGGSERWVELGGAMANVGITFAPAFWGFMAAITQFVGGLSLMLGLFVRPVCVFLIPTMWIAALQTFVTRGNIFGSQAHAFEMSIAYMAILFLGAGKYSLDRKFGLS